MGKQVKALQSLDLNNQQIQWNQPRTKLSEDIIQEYRLNEEAMNEWTKKVPWKWTIN